MRLEGWRWIAAIAIAAAVLFASLFAVTLLYPQIWAQTLARQTVHSAPFLPGEPTTEGEFASVNFTVPAAFGGPAHLDILVALNVSCGPTPRDVMCYAAFSSPPSPYPRLAGVAGGVTMHLRGPNVDVPIAVRAGPARLCVSVYPPYDPCGAPPSPSSCPPEAFHASVTVLDYG